MTEKLYHVVIAGSGGIGSATALLLQQGLIHTEVYLGDASLAAAKEAAAWVEAGFDHPVKVHAFEMPLEGTSPEFDTYLDKADILLDCLPGSEAPRMARLAKKHALHYANVTEYVKETDEIMELGQGIDQGFILQTGLAPGFINVLGMQLFKHFCEDHGVSQADTVKMRVGALTDEIVAPHYYGFTWSKVGVATEYLKPAIVVRDAKKTERPSLTGLEILKVNGIDYEEALTSGGVSDLPEALAGRVRHLDYKTLRHPGHYAWVKNAIETEKLDTPDQLQAYMESHIPDYEADFVVIYASVEGPDAQGKIQKMEKAYHIKPSQVGKHTLRAIQSTTAAGLAESARMLLEGHVKGPILQSDVDPDAFMQGPFVSEIYV
jgi:saccharopine dehydrogenase-like NADP-dependent oxidoreductase